MKTFVVLATLLAAFGPVDAIWPQPQHYSSGSTPLKLSGGFDITSIKGAPSDLQGAIETTKNYLKNDKLERLVVGRGEVDAPVVSKAKTLSKLTLKLGTGATAADAKVASITTEAQKAPEARDEGYTLSVPEDGSGATITANSTLGLYRGLTTFSQLFYYHKGSTYLINAPIAIEDYPAYPYRGFMLDTARNYFPVSDIKRTLDAMSWVKINQLHWHVVDSQSFPLQVPGYTDLAAKGAYSADRIYSPSDVKDIVEYAGARGIDVMVEFDTPGHTSVISKAHPDYIACPEATPWASYANEPPAGQLRLASEEVTQYTAGLISAISKLFPSTLFSTGGDEVNARCYADDVPTQQALNASGKTFDEALDTFVQATHKPLLDSGKTPVVWEEMVLVHNATLDPKTVALVWISSDNVKAVAQKGYKLIHAASDYFYLDCGAGGWVGNFPSGNSWCDPFKTWQRGYTFNPTANLTESEAQLVLGGQHLLWTEQSSPENLDPIVWPRAASSAELFWSGPGGNLSTALPRLHEVAYRMRQRGVRAIALQPEWCALRPGACDLTA